jgi:3-oxoadipate enol-lactonase
MTAHGIYSLSEGAGPAVVLVHAIGCDHRMWDTTAQALSAHFRVIRMDVRGHGRSDALDAKYTLTQLADDVAAVLDQYGVEKASVVGLSLGGMIGQAFALTHPQRLEKLVLACTSSSYGAEGAAMWMARIKTVTDGGMQALRDAAMARYFSESFRAQSPADVAVIAERFLTTPVRGYIGCCHAIAALHFTDALPNIRASTLVIAGEVDVGTPVAMSEILAKGIPNARLSVIPGAAHLAVVEKPVVFNAMVKEFLSNDVLNAR